MFHLGKILEVISPEDKGSKSSDTVTHALLEMWDENLIIFRVSPVIANDVKEGSFVLVDYSPVPVAGAPVPRHEVVSIVNEAKGKKILAKLQDSLEERKKSRITGDGFGVPGKMIG
ncbi:MAG TPA: hypothetical protein VJH23_05375 [archaeon]|nr:hypothetical protein [archaeon]